MNQVNKETRPYKAGNQVAEGLCETANILYLLDNRWQYLCGIRDRIAKELEKVEHLKFKR